MSEDVVYSKILEDGGVRCGHCGAEHSLLPPDKVEVLNGVHCDTCKQPSSLRPDEQLAWYKARGMEPEPREETPSLVWTGTGYATSGPAPSPAPASASVATGEAPTTSGT